jgi:hypothetical protein
VEVTTMAVRVFIFARKKKIVLLDALILFRTFLYLNRSDRTNHNKQFLFVADECSEVHFSQHVFKSY